MGWVLLIDRGGRAGDRTHALFSSKASLSRTPGRRSRCGTRGSDALPRRGRGTTVSAGEL